jgi:hypothetical protein
MDVQGVERVRTVVDPLNLSFPVLIDAENVLGRAYGFLAIPNGFVIDGGGLLRYQRLSSFNIATPAIQDEIMAAVTGEPVGGGAQATADAGGPSPAGEAGVLFSQGVAAFTSGRRDDAVMLWRKARALDPGNFIIRKQIWAVEHPERFYPQIDHAWQKERLALGE